MSKLNFLVFLSTYSDAASSNAPSLSNFKWTREIPGIPASNPISEAFSLAAGESKSIFSGVRTLSQDIDTVYSIALKPLSSNTYRVLNTSGTSPAFRTKRNIGTDATTSVTAVVNGPIVTFTASGVAPSSASFGPMDIPGGTATSFWQANNGGIAGDSITIVGDGTSAFYQLQAAWNSANPGNQVTQQAGNAAQIPSNGATFTLSGGVNGTPAEFNGTPAGFATSVDLIAGNADTSGNSIILTGDGSTDLSTLVGAWNSSNPSNLILTVIGDASQILDNAATIQLAGGVDPIKSQFIGSVATTILGVELSAVTAGIAGNSIVINGNSTQDLDTLISVWNTSNPSNHVQLDAGMGSQIPNSGQVLQLSGGSAGNAAFNMSTVVVGDYVRLGDEFNLNNQGEFKIIAKSSTSFTVESFIGVNEGPIVLGSGFADQIRIYSAAGVQAGDTLVISQGFSPATYGSYKITDVTDNYVEFYNTDPLPQESGISSALDIYSAAKNLVYLEADQKCSVTVNGSVVANMEPFIINDSKQPGVFMLKSTIWSLSVANNSLNSASLFVASIE